VPDVNDPLLGNDEAAPSDNVRFKFDGANASPTSERITIFCPAGPTRSISTSLAHEWLKPLSVTVTLVTVPVIPETLIAEGYGEPDPESGIVIAVAFVNDCVFALR